jgi:hypothetical protein
LLVSFSNHLDGQVRAWVAACYRYLRCNRMLRGHVPVCYADAVADSEAPVPDYSADGVDLSLIRWMLSLTPAERLQFLEERNEEIRAIRELNAGR